MQNQAELGNAVFYAREALGYGREDFAKVAGISLRSLASLERGERTGKKVTARVANALGWPPSKVDQILAGDDPAQDNPGLRDEVEREIWRITDLDEELRWAYITQRRSRLTNEVPEQRSGT